MRDAKSGERNKSFLWRCHGCKRQFTVRIGTVFEDSRIPLKHWCYAFWASCASKKGISAMQIQRQTGLSYKSALFLLHRVRYAMAPARSPRKLKGTVEVDETYVGGKARNMTRGQYLKWAAQPEAKWGHKPKRVTSEKPPVVALVERGGEVRAQVTTNVTSATLKGAIRQHVDRSATINTDELRQYRGIGREFAGGHHAVKHSIGEYARGDVTTNSVEGFFSLLKRGIFGVYHNVSKKHLHRYVAEFEFRYNTRKMDDGARTVAAIRGAEGKRLMYREPLPA
jgi:transposase-like protein